MPQAKEPESVLQRHVASAAVIGDRRSFHSLHHEVRPPVRGLARVEKPRDAGVLQARQDSSLARKTAQNLDGVHAALDELHRDFLFEPPVGALAEIDLAHTAPAERLDQAVDPDRLAAPVGNAPFPGFGFIAGARTTMNVGEAGQQSERIEQRAFALVRTGFGGCPVDRAAIENGGRKIVNQRFTRRHVSFPPPAAPEPVEPSCAPRPALACRAPRPAPRRCSPSRPAQ